MLHNYRRNVLNEYASRDEVTLGFLPTKFDEALVGLSLEFGGVVRACYDMEAIKRLESGDVTGALPAMLAVAAQEGECPVILERIPQSADNILTASDTSAAEKAASLLQGVTDTTSTAGTLVLDKLVEVLESVEPRSAAELLEQYEGESPDHPDYPLIQQALALRAEEARAAVDERADAEEYGYLLVDGHDDALLGVVFGSEGPKATMYSENGILDTLTTMFGGRDEAVEFFEFNIIGAYMGEATPSYFQSIDDIAVCCDTTDGYVKVMADHCSTGIWTYQGPSMTYEQLPVAPELINRLSKWASWFTRECQDFLPEDDVVNKFDYHAFALEGREIAQAIKQALPSWTVIYVDEERIKHEYELARAGQPNTPQYRNEEMTRR